MRAYGDMAISRRLGGLRAGGQSAQRRETQHLAAGHTRRLVPGVGVVMVTLGRSHPVTPSPRWSLQALDCADVVAALLDRHVLIQCEAGKPRTWLAGPQNDGPLPSAR